MLSNDQKATIIRLKDLNWHWSKIAEAVDAKPETVRKFYQRFKLSRDVPPKVRVSKASVRGRLALQVKQIVNTTPQIPYRDIPGELAKSLPAGTNPPSYGSIYRFLNKSGFKMVKLLRKPLVHQRNQLKRVAFAREHINKPSEFWETMIWSDETSVEAIPQGRSIYFKVHGTIKRENLPTQARVQGGGFKVMFWGCFSKLGLGPLVALEGNQNGTTYKELLKEVLLPELAAADREMTFMQDNASCHKSKLVMDFLAENNVKTLPWPPQSPDLNPIENLWAIIKKRRSKKFGFPTKKEELIEQIFDIWNDVNIELCEKLSDSVGRRLEACLKANGKSTKY
jgi:transposase